MTHTVLFLCSMNICRSPLMQWTFFETLPEPQRSTFTVLSRGVSAIHGRAICELSAPLMWGSEAGRQFTQSHASAPLDPADLESIEMVIVATRAEAVTVAQRVPSLRRLTFTLREANLLGARPASPQEHMSIAYAEEVEGRLPLHGFPYLLNRRRGTITLPRPRSRSRRRHPTDPFDIPDAHLDRSVAHGTMLQEVRSETKDLVSRYVEFRKHHLGE